MSSPFFYHQNKHFHFFTSHLFYKITTANIIKYLNNYSQIAMLTKIMK